MNSYLEKNYVFPSALPDHIENNPKLGAEKKVYYKLREQLGNGFHLFYNCLWSDEKEPRQKRDGECDFILAHSNFGILFIEVKGGEVSWDVNSHKWSSRDFHGIIHDIKDPIKQVRNSEGFFRKIIKERLQKIFKKDIWLRTKYAVFFPDSAKTKMNLGSALPLSIFAFLEDIENIMQRSLQILLYEPQNSYVQYDDLGDQGIKLLKEIIGKSFELRTPLSLKLKEDKRIIDMLTVQQKTVLKSLKYYSKKIIIGGAGTGKTTLAIEKALASANEKKKVLILCYNSALRNFFKRRIPKNALIDTFNFHEYCYKRIQNENIDSAKLPDLLLESFDKYPGEYDVLIVDEGQDFSKEWWNPIFFSLKDFDEGTIFIFKDDNQKIYQNENNKFQIPGMEKIPHVLSENMRNTKNIFNASKNFYNGDTDNCNGPRGQIVELIEQQPGKRLLLQVEKLINRLVVIEGIQENEITILTGEAIKNTEFQDLKSIGRYQVVGAESYEEKSIILDSAWRFKGLENKVVILTSFGEFYDNTELLYVALTRAQLKLYIIAPDNTYKHLKQTIKIDG